MIDRRYTKWFKRVRLALRLTRAEVVAVMRCGGSTISNSRADGWMRPENDDRAATMTESEFDAFTRGLADWKRD